MDLVLYFQGLRCGLLYEDESKTSTTHHLAVLPRMCCAAVRHPEALTYLSWGLSTMALEQFRLIAKNLT